MSKTQIIYRNITFQKHGDELHCRRYSRSCYRLKTAPYKGYLQDMLNELNQSNDIIKIVASNPLKTSCEYRKIVLQPMLLREEEYFQAELFKGTQVFHKNISAIKLSE